MVRSSSVLAILTWKCASRHNGVHFFMSHLASWLRTRRFSEPTFRPSGATNHWKNTVNRDFPIFSRIYLFFLLIFSLLTLLTSAFQLSILSEVSLLNFLRTIYIYINKVIYGRRLIPRPVRLRRIWISHFSPNSVLLRVLNAFLRCPPWFWMVCPPSRSLASPCLPLSPHMCACVGWRLPPRSCFWSPIESPHVCPCWMACPPSRGLASPCLPTCVPVLDGVSALASLVSHCLPMCACGGWGIRLPEVLSPLVSHCLPTCVPVLDGVSAFPRSCLPLSPHMCACVGWCVRLPAVFASPCLPLSPHMRACVGWCVRLPEVLPPLVSPHVCLCWMVCPSARGLCLPLSPIVSPHVCLCWIACLPSPGLASIASHCLSLSPHMCACVCPPSRGLVSPCLPLSPRMCACVGWCVRLLAVLPPLVSHCLPTCVPVTAFRGSCLPLSPIVSPHVRLRWMVRPSSRSLASPYLPLSLTCVPVLDGVSTFPGSCLPLSPIVSPHVCLCWMVCPPSRSLAFPCQ